MNDTIRHANEIERNEVNEAIHKEYFSPADGDKVVDHIKDYNIIVIDNYMSDGSGYHGPVYILVWGEPHCVDVLTRKGDGILMVDERE